MFSFIVTGIVQLHFQTIHCKYVATQGTLHAVTYSETLIDSFTRVYVCVYVCV